MRIFSITLLHDAQGKLSLLVGDPRLSVNFGTVICSLSVVVVADGGGHVGIWSMPLQLYNHMLPNVPDHNCRRG